MKKCKNTKLSLKIISTILAFLVFNCNITNITFADTVTDTPVIEIIPEEETTTNDGASSEIDNKINDETINTVTKDTNLSEETIEENSDLLINEIETSEITTEDSPEDNTENDGEIVKLDLLLTDKLDVNNRSTLDSSLSLSENKYAAIPSNVRSELINSFYRCFANTTSDLDISKYNISTNDSDAILEIFLKALDKDLIVSSSYESISGDLYYNKNTNCFTSVKFKYSHTNAQFKQRYEKLKSAATAIVNTVDKSYSDFEKALYLHDYLIYNTSYDYDNYVKDNIPDVSHTAYGPLINKVGVCDGYAKAYSILLRLVNIDSFVVTSDYMCHAWSLAKIDNEWYHVDPTWNDPAPNIRGYVGHDFFLCNDSEMKKNNYSNWDSGNIKTTSTKYSNWRLRDNKSKFIYVDGYYYSVINNNIVNSKIDGSSSTIFSLQATSIHQYKGKLYYTTAKGIYSCYYDGSNTKTVYSFNNSKESIIALEIDENGLAYYSTADSSNNIKTYKYQINDNVIPLDSISLNKSNATLNVNGTVKLSVFYSPSNTTDSKSIIWSSNKTSVATVDSTGRVTAKATGTATITAKVGNKTATCTVTVTTTIPTIKYTSSMQNKGWLDYTSNGGVSGAIGQNLRLEAIKLQSTGISDLGIKYTSHVQSIGWQDWASNNEISGTTGKSLRLEAIKIQLTGNNAGLYDIYYRVYVENYGWLGWAKNGEAAGTEGYGARIEGYQLKIVLKDVTAPGSTSNSFLKKVSGVNYKTHIQNIGWQDWKKDGVMSGTTGEAKRLEAIQIKLNDPAYSGSISYRSHIQNIGWQDWKKDGAMSGTSGQSKRLEAIEIKLTGKMSEKYDIYYRVHVQNYGWLDWSKNGEPAGTEGLAKRLEGIEIILVNKDEPAPGSTDKSFIKK